MARRDFGTIIEIERGKKYGLRWTQNTDTGRKKRYETFHGNRTDAKARLHEIEHEVRSSGSNKIVPTVGYAYEKWYLPGLEARVAAGRIKGRTVDQYRKFYAKYLAEWVDTPVTEVKPLGVEEWLSRMTKSVGSTSRIVMKGILDECVKRELIPANPARAKLIDSSVKGELDKGIWTLEELDDMAWASRGEIFFYSVILMGFGSCRPGESLGPMLSDIRKRECMGMKFADVNIIRQVVTDGTLTTDDDLKNGFSPRHVFIPEPWCYPVLYAAENPEEGQVLLSDSGYGNHFRQYQIYTRFKKMMRSGAIAGLEYHPWKNIRNSWETWINWRNKISPQKIEKLIGHVGDGITAVYYDRPLDVQLMEEIASSFAMVPYESPHPWMETYPIRW